MPGLCIKYRPESGYSFAALRILAAIVLYAFRTSLGDRPIFGTTPRLDDWSLLDLAPLPLREISRISIHRFLRVW